GPAEHGGVDRRVGPHHHGERRARHGLAQPKGAVEDADVVHAARQRRREVAGLQRRELHQDGEVRVPPRKFDYHSGVGEYELPFPTRRPQQLAGQLREEHDRAAIARWKAIRGYLAQDVSPFHQTGRAEPQGLTLAVLDGARPEDEVVVVVEHGRVLGQRDDAVRDVDELRPTGTRQPQTRDQRRTVLGAHDDLGSVPPQQVARIVRVEAPAERYAVPRVPESAPQQPL